MSYDEYAEKETRVCPDCEENGLVLRKQADDVLIGTCPICKSIIKVVRTGKNDPSTPNPPATLDANLRAIARRDPDLAQRLRDTAPAPLTLRPPPRGPRRRTWPA